ncbi:MAG: hypothetical protein SGILL_001295 [Bacillariaceae sp.]
MLFSAAQGAFALFGEPNRKEFIDILESGTIQEKVVQQATFGPAMMLSLFQDLQNPLFKRTKFDPPNFLKDVAPAMENFHNVGGALENQLQVIMNGAGNEPTNSDEDATMQKKNAGKIAEDSSERDEMEVEVRGPENERDVVLSAMRIFGAEGQSQQAAAILDHEWSKEAEKDPDSEAGQLGRMVTEELFHMHEMNAKTAFLLQNHIKNITFQEGSCQVNNVALLSARAFAFEEKESETSDGDSSDDVEKGAEGPQYKMVDCDPEDEESYANASVAAQVEILYDVTQEFLVEKSAMPSEASSPSSPEESTVKERESAESSTLTSDGAAASSSETESRKTTILSVATLEGWLKGGPDKELRWKLALHRPAFEFPGFEHSY